jgi:hypothetical protein
MADKRLDRLESFRAFIQATEEGAPVPPVSEEQLRHLHKIHLYTAKWHPGSDGAVSMDLMASVCGSEADLPAVWFRHTRLRLLLRQGFLAEWQNGTALDDVVYRVAATIPMNLFQLDQEEFIQRLRCEAAA